LIFTELEFKRYKYIVNVVLGQQHGAGVKIGTRCIWDAEADTYAYDSFINVRKRNFICFLYNLQDISFIFIFSELIVCSFQDTIFCVAIVYAIYFY